MSEVHEPRGHRRRRLLLAARALLFLALASLGSLVVLGWLRSDLEAPDATYLLRDRHGAFLGEASPDPERGYGFWPVDEIPPRVAAATLVVEDRRFHRHPGVDPVAIVRALTQNVSSAERVSGASTLAMQVARLQRPGPRTYPRKALEAVTALFLTARHGRDAVLRHYLRLVPYGHQIHGIAYGARRYLDKPVADLSWAEVAFLTALPQAPSRMSPFDPRGRARAVRRGLQILDLLRDEGHLDEEQWRLATRQIHRLRIPPRAQRPEEALHAVLRLEDDLVSGRLATSGPIVDTNLDLGLQGEVQFRLARRLASWRGRGAGNGALLVLERTGSSPASGRQGVAWRVRAAAGSAAWGDADHAGSIDYLRVPRSSGSTLKPFFFARALDRGRLDAVTVLDDLGRGAGGIVNSDGRFLGPLLPRFALGNSRNVPAANLLDQLGLGAGWSLLTELGLHDGSEPPERYGLGLTLGSLAVTLEDLATAYTALAGDGRVHQALWLTESPGGRPRRVISEDAARQVALFLSDPQARLPSFPRMGHLEYPYAVAVKTGTSSRRRDAWTVAWSSRYLVAAWVGHPDHRPMEGLTGYSSAARLVRDVMDLLHPELERGLSDAGFPPPRGHEAVKVCTFSGRRAGPACPRSTAEWLTPGRGASLGDCPVHRHVAVDRETGLLADHRTARDRLEIRSVADLPPRYLAWALDAGLALPPPSASARVVASHGADPASHLGRAFLPTALSAAPARAPTVRIVSPADDLHLLVDPESPPSLSTLELKAEVDAGAGEGALRGPVELLWFVDGEPFELATHPESVRWPLRPGDHTIRVEVPSVGLRSGAVRVRVE